MCGIFGIVTPGVPIPWKPAWSAIQSLVHRGPDGLGIVAGQVRNASCNFYLNPESSSPPQEQAMDYFLGHRRLSIIDLAPEAFQPMCNETQSVWVVFNGEIYNHTELREDLKGRGHLFKTHHSDTEVLVHGYEEWGNNLVDHLRGMFAFAILDLAKQKVLLARDRFGEKPLYVASVEGGIAFASELKALYAGNNVKRQINMTGLADYLRFGYIPAPHTIYEGIRKLRAAERVVIDLKNPEIWESSKYWSLAYNPQPVRNVAEWHEEFESELANAVKLRLISDVPLGAFLSGGLDSSVVVREMSKVSNSCTRTFNIGFSTTSFDESPYAEKVATRYRTQHQSRSLSPDDLLQLLPQLTATFDEPFADSSAVPTLAVAKMAREQVTVCLSGDGGDELLAGYSRYRINDSLSRCFDHLPGMLLSGLIHPMIGIWPEHVRGYGIVALCRSNAKLRFDKMIGDRFLLDRSELARMPGQFHLDSIWDSDVPTLINKMSKADIEHYIPEDLMVKVDRTAMAVSLESRAPLLDHVLFEFIARSPLELRYSKKVGKLPFRKLLAPELGDDFVQRNKQGFAVPLGRWFRGPLKNALRDVVESPDSFTSTIFSPTVLRQLLQQHIHGSRDQSSRLWRLFMLEQWHRQYGS